MSARGWSDLLTTRMSAISRMPALIACTSSPAPGTLITIVVWAVSATSTSSCPAPTVSTMITSLCAASITVTTSFVVGASPPSAPRAASVRGRRQPAQRPARRHRADEHAGIGGELLHPDPVAQHSAAAERARRVYRHYPHAAPARPVLAGQRSHQRALAGPRRPGDPTELAVAAMAED